MRMLFAQATGVPDNGASNAQDFQPPTRNPQTAPGSLQPGGGSQSTSNQDILNAPNTRIVVPSGTPEPAAPAPPADGGGFSVFLVIVPAAIIVAALEYFFFQRRDRNRVRYEAPAVVAAAPEAPVDTAVPPSAKEPAEKVAKKPKASKKQPTKKKKSKSKRKHK